MPVVVPLLLWLSLTTERPTLYVYPRFANAPATVTIIARNLPDNARVLCVALDGPNYYGGCQEVDGRRSVQVQYKDARAGHYVALATVDGKIIAQVEVVLTGLGGSDDDGDL